jgi:hypothetical protein
MGSLCHAIANTILICQALFGLRFFTPFNAIGDLIPKSGNIHSRIQRFSCRPDRATDYDGNDGLSKALLSGVDPVHEHYVLDAPGIPPTSVHPQDNRCFKSYHNLRTGIITWPPMSVGRKQSPSQLAGKSHQPLKLKEALDDGQSPERVMILQIDSQCAAHPALAMI